MGKKILCLIDTLGMGGAERQMIGLALFLKQKGYFVDLVTYNDHNFYSELVQKYGLGSVSIHVKNNKFSKLKAVKKHIKRNSGYDWVIAYKDGPCVIGCMLKILGGNFKLIVSERNTTQYINRYEKIKFFFYRWADYIVPNSYAQEKLIKDNFPKLQNKTVAITNFTDTVLFTPSAFQSNQKMTIVTAARISNQKNVLNYLEAIKKLKDIGGSNIHFEWYGDVQSGEEQYGESCLKRRQELDIEEMISFYPATTDIVKHYQNCDIFCLPSRYEGFPNVICEAMSCGKPIVCSRVCDNPQIVQENINGLFFNPIDVDDIASQLIKICSMPKMELQSWANKSRAIAVDLFSKEAFVTKYIKIINLKRK